MSAVYFVLVLLFAAAGVVVFITPLLITFSFRSLPKDFDYTKSGGIGQEEFINMYHMLIYVRSVSGPHTLCPPHTHTHTRTCTHAHTHTQPAHIMYGHTYTHTHTQPAHIMYGHTYTHTHTTHAHTHTHTHTQPAHIMYGQGGAASLVEVVYSDLRLNTPLSRVCSRPYVVSMLLWCNLAFQSIAILYTRTLKRHVLCSVCRVLLLCSQVGEKFYPYCADKSNITFPELLNFLREQQKVFMIAYTSLFIMISHACTCTCRYTCTYIYKNVYLYVHAHIAPVRINRIIYAY